MNISASEEKILATGETLPEQQEVIEESGENEVTASEPIEVTTAELEATKTESKEDIAKNSPEGLTESAEESEENGAVPIHTQSGPTKYSNLR